MGDEGIRGPASPNPGDEHFERLAETADAVARTAELSAHVHDKLAERMPSTARRAATDRRLAAAQAEAAEAFRAHQLPSQAVRETISAGVDAQAYIEQHTIDMELRDTELGLRAMALEDRERWLDGREAYRSDRQDERDRRADARDLAADERDRRADARDATLTERAKQADERDSAADQREINQEVERSTSRRFRRPTGGRPTGGRAGMNEQQPRKGDFPPEAAPPMDDEFREELEEQQEADIAAEHDDLTVGEQERGGPEGAAENESPNGYGGGDLPGKPG